MSLIINQRVVGFTLLEILVALSLFGAVAAATLKLAVRARRTYEEQLDRLAVQGDLRVGLAIIESELRGLDADDPGGSDLLETNPTSITYNAMRVLAFLCRDAAVQARTLHLWPDPWYGQRLFDPRSDSLLIYTGSGTWARANLSSAASGRSCPGETESLSLSVDGSVDTPLASGTPVRGFEGARLHLYRSDGYWLGSSRRYKDGQWTRTQPLIGPLAPQGFLLSYENGAGTAGTASDVAAIGVRLIVVGRGGSVRDSIGTLIGLRNNSVRVGDDSVRLREDSANR